MEPPDPTQPGMFALARPEALSELLETAGFVDVVVEPVAVRPSRCRRSRTVVVVSATFWWMYELAKRVSARVCRSTVASASVPGPPTARTRSSTCAARSS